MSQPITTANPHPQLSGPPDDYESVSSAAARFDVNPMTIRRMIARGDLAGYRLGKRLLRVRRADVDALLQPVPTATSTG